MSRRTIKEPKPKRTEVLPGSIDIPMPPTTPPLVAAASNGFRPQVTTAAAWKAKKTATWLLTLPSATVVRVHMPDWTQIAATGALAAGELQRQLGSIGSFRPEDLLPAARALVPFLVVEPKVLPLGSNGDTPEGAVAVEDVPDGDLVTVLLWMLTQITPIEGVAIQAIQEG